MSRVITFKAVQPRSRFSLVNPITIPHSPTRVALASLRITIPITQTKNTVKLEATVGVRGVTGIAQVLFRIFRDGREIFNTQSGIESTGSEQNYTISFQAIDQNLSAGTHKYVLTAENRTSGTTARVVGPISFSALAITK